MNSGDTEEADLPGPLGGLLPNLRFLEGTYVNCQFAREEIGPTRSHSQVRWKAHRLVCHDQHLRSRWRYHQH